MADKTIPIVSQNTIRTLPIPQTGDVREVDGFWVDRLNRPLRDIRISLTDHCNFRCRYCMPKEVFHKQYRFLSMTELLTFEEIYRVAKLVVAHGIEKIRLTGGEPLLRKGVEKLIEKLRSIKTPKGKDIDIAMTTNGSLLVKKARELKDAGLDRVTVSLDAIDEAIFQQFNDVGFPASKVIEGIEYAANLGFQVKVNTVVKKGINEKEVVKIAERFKGTCIIPRFIEYMDVGTANGWRMTDVVPSREIVRLISEKFEVEPLSPNYKGETASRWKYVDGSGEFGCISSVTQAFCRNCSRARLSMDGRLYLCLFADEGFDIRTLLRGGASDFEIAEAFGRIWTERGNRYSELRAMGLAPQRAKVEMNYIGG